jgi:DNA-binding MarR family transcriptional regulator
VNLEKAIKQSKFDSEHTKMVVNILYTSKWIEYRESRLFKQYGLTLPQYNVMRILRGQYPEACSVNLLIDRMIDKSSNASRIVEKLRKKGLVERKTCRADRRRVDVVINRAGLELLKKADAELDELHAEHMETLTEKEAATLNQLLDKLRTTQKNNEK